MDPDCIHWLLMDEKEHQPIGTVRLYPPTGKVGRLALLPPARGKGLGKKLLLTLEEKAKDLGVEKLKLHAQVDAETFYKKCGFETQDPNIFYEENIPHVLMTKRLK